MPAREVAQQVEAARTVDDGHDGRGVVGPDDEVPFEVPDLGALVRVLGACVDQVEGPEHAGLPQCIPTATTSLATGTLAVQVPTQPAGQSLGPVGIDGLVDGLGRGHVATDAARASELDGDRRRRVLLAQALLDVAGKRPFFWKVVRFGRPSVRCDRPWALVAQYRARPPLRFTSRVTVEGSRSRRRAMPLNDSLGLNTNAYLFALVRAQCCTCHDDLSNGSSLGVARSS